MTKKEYFQDYVTSVGGKLEAAKRLGISISLVRSICNGNRGITPKTALRVERDSHGLYKKDLLIWGDAA